MGWWQNRRRRRRVRRQLRLVEQYRMTFQGAYDYVSRFDR